MIEPLTTIDEAGDWFLERVASVLADERPGLQPALVERRARGGQMPPLTTRDEDEVYRVAEGEVTFFVGSEEIVAGPGDVVVAPGGVERTFRVESDRASWAVLTHVHSLARFEDFGRALSWRLARGWTSLDEEVVAAAIGTPNGIEVIGPPGMLPGEAFG